MPEGNQKFRRLNALFGDPAPVDDATEKKEDNNGVLHLPISELVPYPKQGTFKPYTEQKLKELTDSIAQHGVLSPVLVRPREDGGYELIAGHNRTEGSKLAGKDTIPAIVRELDDETADILFVDTNLNQREVILISERAKSYRVKYDALKRQGKRTDLIDDEHSGKRAAEVIGGDDDMSARTVYRYFRLGHLCDELLDLADLSRINIVTGEELSYISPASGQAIAFYLQTHDKAKIQLDHAKKLRKQSQEMELDEAAIAQILGAPTPQKPKALSKTVKIPLKKIKDAFTGDELEAFDDNSLVDMIIKAILAYKFNGTEVLNE